MTWIVMTGWVKSQSLSRLMGSLHRVDTPYQSWHVTHIRISRHTQTGKDDNNHFQGLGRKCYTRLWNNDECLTFGVPPDPIEHYKNHHINHHKWFTAYTELYPSLLITCTVLGLQHLPNFVRSARTTTNWHRNSERTFSNKSTICDKQTISQPYRNQKS